METKLRQLIKEAMIAKAKNKCPETENRYQTLKNILETAQKLAKEKQTEVADSFIIDAAKKEIKQAQDLLNYCTGNLEKSAELNFCIEVASELLPVMASDEAIIGFIQAHKTEATNIGAMMKLLKAEFGDALDCKKASQLTKENL